VSSGRVRQQEPEAVAAQLWSFVHGCITLELADHFVEFDDPVGNARFRYARFRALDGHLYELVERRVV